MIHTRYRRVVDRYMSKVRTVAHRAEVTGVRRDSGWDIDEMSEIPPEVVGDGRVTEDVGHEVAETATFQEHRGIAKALGILHMVPVMIV